MIAGTLEVELVAGMARLQADMDKGVGIVRSGAQAMAQAADSAKAALAGIGVSLSAGAFVAWIRGAIDSADALNDLSKSTSMTVGQLAGLGMLARSSGTDLQSLAAGINKLQVEIGKNGEQFRSIGITAKDGLGSLKQLSDLYIAIEDPQLRAAVAAEALSKGWASSAAVLALGSEEIQRLIDRGEILSGVTQQTADQADAFNDKLEEMRTASSGTATRIAAGLLPILNALLESMVESKEKTEDLAGSFNPLNETLRAVIVLGGNVAFVLQQIGDGIGGIAAAAVQLATGRGLQGFADIIQGMRTEAKDSRAALDAWEAKMMAAGTAAEQTATKAEGASKKLTAAQLAALKLFADQKARAEAEAAAKAAQKELQDQAKLLAELSGLTGSFADDWDRLSRIFASGKISMEQLVEAQAALLAKQPAIKKAADDRTKAAQNAFAMELAAAEETARALVEEDKQREQGRLSLLEYTRGIDEMLGRLDVERSMVAKTAEQRAVALEQYQIELDLKKQLEAIDRNLAFSEEQREELRMRARLKAQQAASAAEERISIEQDRKRSESLAASIETGILNGFRSGQSLAEIFITELKAQFARTVLRPLIEPVAGAGNSVLSGVLKQLTPGGMQAAFSQTSLGSSGFGTGLAYGNMDIGGFLAEGGPARAGVPYVVGERGPELFVPQTSGTVVPNDAMRGGDTITINIDSRADRAEVYANVQRALAQRDRQWGATLAESRGF